MGIRQAKSVRISTKATFATRKISTKKVYKKNVKNQRKTLYTYNFTEMYLFLLLRVNSVSSEQRGASSISGNIFIIVIIIIIIIIIMIGCGVIGEDLFDQDPPRTKRQQRDQGGNGRTWPNWKDDLD